uniref:SDR family NAD(P)-dependent oxidoreductase n=1 Tax=Marinobacter sediminum TaxID=256323 RepID=UPI0035641151
MPSQTVWITGASSGIGEALALRFAKEGASLVLSARRKDELERVAGRCRDIGLPADQVLVLPLDVTDWASLPVAVQAVLDAFGVIDLLVNNAGVSQRSLCQDTDMAVYQKLMDVDVMG